MKFMVNKILQIGKIDSENDSSKPFTIEVFRDISMASKPQAQNKYKIARNANALAVKGSLRNIFSWVPGERILLPEFGSRLYTLLYEGITEQTEERVAAEIRHCVSEWEPRAQIVEIRNISTDDDTENNTIHLEIIYTIPALNDEQYSYGLTYTIGD